MVLRSEQEELHAAWRALADNPGTAGWRTIPVAPGGPCRLLAGRRFPGNEEALLVGFASVRVPPTEQFPQGRGFLVSGVDLGHGGTGHIWIALCRQNAGSLDLFAMMADDVISTLEKLRSTDDQKLLQVFLARIRAWQDFMSRGGDGVLGSEAEVGLFGELDFLFDLISAGLPASIAVDAWQGPLDGIQDFSFGTGAIEVKSTISPDSFPANIISLDQLDDSLIQPIFLAGIRFAQDAFGLTLSEQINKLRDQLHMEPSALCTFNSRLLHAGFLDVAAERYTRRFSRTGRKILAISDGFPRLTRTNVAIEIRRVRYEINLNMVTTEDVKLADVLVQLGVTQE